MKNAQPARTMPPWAKPLIEIGPLVAFFVAYKLGGFIASTAVAIVASIIAAAISYALTRRIPPMLVVTVVVVIIFGGLTIATDNKTFFFMKPTIIMGLFAAILIGGLLLGRPLLKSLMGTALELDDAGWRKLTARFAIFFIAVAVLNEIIWRTQPEATWVNFKAFGILGLNVIFILTQFPLIKRHQLKSPADR
jgi:intracellular septation protein